ncbi:glycosyltransferase family 9 protein [Flagellimonas eckloniae]|nr:glycosyltransferase family 9 protein [Allomuricauda eckloniae]
MKKFLVIQQKMIGDVLTSTILCEHLKIHFPESQVHFVINENTQAVVKGNPHIDEVVLFKDRYKKSKLDFYGFLKSIKKENYDVVIDVYCKFESNLISYFSKAAIKISYKKWYSKFIYTHLFTYSNNPDTKLGFAIENRLLLLSPLIQELDEKDLAPKIYLSDSEITQAEKLLKESKVDTTKPVLMIGVMGSDSSKSYPLEYLSQVIDFISKDLDVTFLFNYMPSQKGKVEELISLCSQKSRDAIREDIFCPSLRSFLGLLGQCDGYVGNEGGSSNMSKALGIPNFSIFSPWISKKAWLTFNDDKSNQAVHLSDFNPEILTISKKERKKNALEFYKSLKPQLFEEQLRSFVEDEIFTNK